jgi:two-component system sensor histidine kinase UhpB
MMVMLRRLLRLSTICKIFLANSAIVAIGAVVGTQVAIAHGATHPTGPHWDLMLLFGLGGVLVSMLVNFLVLRTALHPLNCLHDTARRVQEGDFTARVPRLLVSDSRFDRLGDTFNEMLASVQRDQRQLQEMSWQVLRAQEEERRRIARELHDETAQALTSLLVRLRLLTKARTPEELSEKVAELRRLTAGALEEVRRLALELRPSVLDDLGLVAALGWHIDEYNTHHRTKVELAMRGIDRRLPAELELALFRVTQEALTNVARHAEAKRARVDLTRDDGWVSLSVRDDGRGFDVAEALGRKKRGLGIFGMQERVSLLGGEFLVSSAPGEATTVRVRIPLKGAE